MLSRRPTNVFIPPEEVQRQREEDEVRVDRERIAQMPAQVRMINPLKQIKIDDISDERLARNIRDREAVDAMAAKIQAMQVVEETDGHTAKQRGSMLATRFVSQVGAVLKIQRAWRAYHALQMKKRKEAELQAARARFSLVFSSAGPTPVAPKPEPEIMAPDVRERLAENNEVATEYHYSRQELVRVAGSSFRVPEAMRIVTQAPPESLGTPPAVPSRTPVSKRGAASVRPQSPPPQAPVGPAFSGPALSMVSVKQTPRPNAMASRTSVEGALRSPVASASPTRQGRGFEGPLLSVAKVASPAVTAMSAGNAIKSTRKSTEATRQNLSGQYDRSTLFQTTAGPESNAGPSPVARVLGDEFTRVSTPPPQGQEAWSRDRMASSASTGESIAPSAQARGAHPNAAGRLYRNPGSTRTLLGRSANGLPEAHEGAQPSSPTPRPPSPAPLFGISSAPTALRASMEGRNGAALYGRQAPNRSDPPSRPLMKTFPSRIESGRKEIRPSAVSAPIRPVSPAPSGGFVSSPGLRGTLVRGPSLRGSNLSFRARAAGQEAQGMPMAPSGVVGSRGSIERGSSQKRLSAPPSISSNSAVRAGPGQTRSQLQGPSQGPSKSGQP